MSPVGIVIVTYNSHDVIGTCLQACVKQGVPTVVVDNASTDGTPDTVRRFPSVQLIANTVNRGFAGGCNQGAAALDTETILLLNPDAEPLNSLLPLVEAVRQPGVAIAGGRLIDQSGHDQRGFAIRELPTALTLMLEVLGINRMWPGNALNQRYRCLDHDPRLASKAAQPAGAFLLVRRDVWNHLGGLDEQFHPLWFEDVDFCRRVQEAGYMGRYEPASIARHQGGHSVERLTGTDRPMFWYGSLIQYALKSYPRWGRMGVGLAVLLAALLRGTVGLFSRRARTPVSTYWGVGRMAVAVLWRAVIPVNRKASERPR